MAPFTFTFNVYGLFIVLFGLLISAYYITLNYLERIGTSFQTKLLFIIFYISPLSYFVLHNEHYGFHTEMLLIPLGLLFIYTLFRNSRWYLLWALLIILIKEDAVIVLWSFNAAFLLSKWTQNEINTRQFLFKAGLLSFYCLLIFTAGFAWLKYQNNGGETRIGWVMQSMLEQNIQETFNSFIYLLGLRVQLTLCVLFIILIYSGWKFTLGAMLISIPILLLNFLAGTLYFDNGEFMIKNFFSLLWSPRLSMYWSYWLVLLFISLTRKPSIIIYPKKMRTAACIIFGIFVFRFQYFFILNCYVTRFNIIEDIREVFRTNNEFIVNPEFSEAAAIAKELPDHYPVAPMYSVFGAFYRQDIVWLNAIQNAYYPARMVIASYNKDEIPDMTKFLKSPYSLVYKENLYIYAEGEDTVYVSNAGIHGTWIKVVPEN
jgi:hypothetical protein